MKGFSTQRELKLRGSIMNHNSSNNFVNDVFDYFTDEYIMNNIDNSLINLK